MALPEYRSSRLGAWTLPADRAAIMGIVNLTPDSFSDGGRLLDRSMLREHLQLLIDSGADLLDVGAESTRPGAMGVDPDDQLRRLEPFFELLTDIPVPVSLDTRSGRVAQAGLDAGVEVLNDVSMGRHDQDLAAQVKAYGAVLVLMHSRGTPADMDEQTSYDDPVSDVVAEWRDARVRLGFAADDQHVWFDPGLGFAKTVDQCWVLLRAVADGAAPADVSVIGASRKRMTDVCQLPPVQRDPATHAIVARMPGTGIVHRVHDVCGAVQALRAAHCLEGAVTWN